MTTMSNLIVSVGLLVFVSGILAELPCDTNGRYYAPLKKCFYAFSNVGTYARSSAGSQCASKVSNGTLVSIHSYDENTFLRSMLTGTVSSSYQYWTGLSVKTSSPATNQRIFEYSWADGSNVDYTNLNTAQCSIGVSSVEFNKDSGVWGCTLSTYDYLVCQAPPLYTCPPGTINYPATNRCYQFVTSKKSWEDARSNCLQSKGDLVSMHSYAENAFVTSEARNRGISVYWSGFNEQITNTKTYTWSDMTGTNYTRWNSGVPATCKNGATNCVSIETNYSEWYNCWDCDRQLSSVCVVPMVTVNSFSTMMAMGAFTVEAALPVPIIEEKLCTLVNTFC